VDLNSIPLAERLRPNNLKDFVGQKHLVGQGSVLQKLIEQDLLPSFIFWGPPGSGKTTLARNIAQVTKSHFVANPLFPQPLPMSGKLSLKQKKERTLTMKKRFFFLTKFTALIKPSKTPFYPMSRTEPLF
jgi:putative ATPase